MSSGRWRMTALVAVATAYLVTMVGTAGADGPDVALARFTAEPVVGEPAVNLASANPESGFDLVAGVPEPALAPTATTTGSAATSATTKAPPVPSSLPGGTPSTDADTAVVSDDAPPAEDAGEGAVPWGVAVPVAVVAAGVVMVMAYAMRSDKDDPVNTEADQSAGGAPSGGDPGRPDD